jgi:hypothetical protein
MGVVELYRDTFDGMRVEFNVDMSVTMTAMQDVRQKLVSLSGCQLVRAMHQYIAGRAILEAVACMKVAIGRCMAYETDCTMSK